MTNCIDGEVIYCDKQVGRRQLTMQLLIFNDSHVLGLKRETRKTNIFWYLGKENGMRILDVFCNLSVSKCLKNFEAASIEEGI